MNIINTGVNPTGVAYTDNKVYVANNNNYGIANEDSVSVINLDDYTVNKIHDPSFNEPYTITIHGKYAYITNSNSDSITIMNIKNDKVVDIIEGLDGPSGFVAHKNIGYVNNYGGPDGVKSGNGNTISVVDLKTKLIIDTIIINPTIPAAPARLAISPNGKYVYCINYVNGEMGTGTMSIINTKTNKIIYTIYGFSGPFDIALTPNGKEAYVTNFGSNNFAPFGTTVSVIDLKKFSIKNITTGIQPSGVAISPNGKFAYVTNYNTLYAGENFTKLTPGVGTVSVIDTKTYKVINTIQVNQGPANICTDGNNIYVTNFISNVLNIIKVN